MRIKKGDTVEVISGDDKGTRGTVRRVIPGREVLSGRTPAAKGHVGADHERDLVLVSGVNIVKKHVRPNPMKGQTGGIVDKTMPIDISNVMLFNPATKKGDRVGFKTVDGKKVRVFKSNDAVVGSKS